MVVSVVPPGTPAEALLLLSVQLIRLRGGSSLPAAATAQWKQVGQQDKRGSKKHSSWQRYRSEYTEGDNHAKAFGAPETLSSEYEFS
jgi:hypothetical protein